MRTRLYLSTLAGLLFLMLQSCGTQPVTVAPPTIASVAPVPPQVQAVLDRLNDLDPIMFDLHECPERYPPLLLDWYGAGWGSAAETELKEMGWGLRWNCGEGKYELATEEAPKPICDCAPPVIQMSDLVGDWQVHYTSAPPGTQLGKWIGVETLTLRADGTYRQVYDDGQGNIQIGPWNKWRIERLPNGPTLVWLDNGRFYPLEMVDGAVTGGPYHYSRYDSFLGYEVRLEGTGVVLGVNAFFPDVSRASLLYPPVGELDSETWVQFDRVITPTPTTP